MFGFPPRGEVPSIIWTELFSSSSSNEGQLTHNFILCAMLVIAFCGYSPFQGVPSTVSFECIIGFFIPQRFRDIFAAEQYRPVFFGECSDVAAL